MPNELEEGNEVDSPKTEKPLSFEESASLAGKLVSRMEDLCDDLELALDDLNDMPDDNDTQEEQVRAAARRLAGDLRGALKKARDAKAEVAGAAAAGKKFKDAKPHIKGAEDSFKEAKKKLRDFEKKDRAAGAKIDANELQSLRDLVKEAHELITDDVEKLKAALEVIL